MELQGEPRGMGVICGCAAGASLILALFAANMAAGNGRESVVRFTSPDGGPNQEFGRHVAIDDDVAVITEPEWGIHTPAGPGTAYVYRYNAGEDDWLLEAQLHPFGGFDGPYFGGGAATDGEVIVIYCQCEDEFVSFVFRYEPDSASWVEEQVLPGSSRADINGDLLVIGGRVYRYDQQSQSWFLEQELEVEWFGSGGGGGGTAAINEDRIVLGYPTNDDLGNNAGTARVFEYDDDQSEWRQTARLNASDAAEWDRFGQSVDLAADFVAVGAPESSMDYNEPGTVYIFHGAGESWAEVAMITPDDGAWGDNFGYDIAFDGSTLLVGSNDNGPDGAAYVYNFDTQTYEWSLTGKLRPTSSYACDFGTSVDFSGSHFLIGDFRDYELGDEAGAAYIYQVVVNDCPADVNLDEVVDIDDLFQVLGAWGPCEDCPEDINEDGVVDIDDVFAVLADWGPC